MLGIVKAHGGFVDVASHRGVGTTFRIYLPAAPDEPVPAGPAPNAAPPWGAGRTVLVVDDEEAIRSVARGVLENQGYRVLLAADGAEALAVVADQRATIALVVTDIAMPFMDGLTMIRALHKMAPEIPVIASTGQCDLARVAELRALRMPAVLHKPYGTETLLLAIAETLHLPATTGASA